MIYAIGFVVEIALAVLIVILLRARVKAAPSFKPIAIGLGISTVAWLLYFAFDIARMGLS